MTLTAGVKVVSVTSPTYVQDALKVRKNPKRARWTKGTARNHRSTSTPPQTGVSAIESVKLTGLLRVGWKFDGLQRHL